jgi:uncharacterized sporulation protein YeaH/YhbH (DUF444 family)
MFQWFIDVFRAPSIRELEKRQLSAAQRFLLAHEGAAEYHAAMATMLRNRIDRIQNKEDPVAYIHQDEFPR